MQMCHLTSFFVLVIPPFTIPALPAPVCPPTYISRSSQATPIVIGTFASVTAAHDENKDLVYVRGTTYIMYTSVLTYIYYVFNAASNSILQVRLKNIIIIGRNKCAKKKV